MTKLKTTSIITLLIAVLVVIAIVISPYGEAQQSVSNRSIALSSSYAGAAGISYDISFTTDAPGLTLGSFYLQFCSNSPLIGDVCNPIAGFDVSAATITSQSGVTDFSIGPGATANSILLTRPSSFVAGNTDVTVRLSNVHNPTNTGTFYGRIQLFPTVDGSGASSNEGGMTFAIENPVDITTWVPPWLFICVGVTVPGYYCSGDINTYINLGEISPRYTAYATSEVIVATNATSGYVLSVTGTTLTSGNNTISAAASPTVSTVGISQFGINLRDNSLPDVGREKVGAGAGLISANYNIPNRYMFTTGDTLASSVDTSLGEKYTISYIVNVAKQQNPGIYVTTLVYGVLATF